MLSWALAKTLRIDGIAAYPNSPALTHRTPMSKQPNYSMDRQNRDRAKQAKKAAKAEEKAQAKHDAVPDPAAPMAPEKPSSDR